MSAAEPVVSVVLRTYQHAPFVAQAIESVLIQRADFPYEVVIGEDCSVDGTREIVRGYAERFPDRVRAVLPEENLGHGQILLRAIEAARGRYLAYLDGDDYWTSPEKLRRQVDYLEGRSDCFSCFHDVSLVYDAAGMPSGAVTPGLAEADFSLEDILAECFVGAPSMMFRREIAEALPPWAWESAWIDWLFHIRAAECGPLGYIPEPMAAYRVHEGGMFSALDRVSQLEEDLRFYKRLVPEMPAQAELIERFMQYRRCQLAIERLGVPFDAVVVLVDPRRELRPYFNGRHARNLPRRDGREVSELEAIRRAAATLAPAHRDYGGEEGTEGGGAGCYVVVPADAVAWLEEHGGLRDYLRSEGREAWADTSVVVYSLTPAGHEGEARRAPRRLSAERLPLGPELQAGNLESPAADAELPAHAVFLSGWVLGRETAVREIEWRCGDEVIWRAPVNRPRPDIEEAFPELEVGAPGFRTTLNTCDLPRPSVVEGFAVLADGRRAPFALLRLQDGEG